MSQQKDHSYDVIVVGSGASGGWACKRLAEAGLKVALLEAGRPQSDKNFTEHQPAFELKYRNRAKEIVRKTRPIQVKFGVCNERSEEHTSELQSPCNLVCRLLLEKKQKISCAFLSVRSSNSCVAVLQHC